MTTSSKTNTDQPERREALLSIAGFDPTGGAGIGLDAAVFRALGFHPLTVLTSATAQGARGVVKVRPLVAQFISSELEIIWSEFQPRAVKIGMIYNFGAIRIVASSLRRQDIPIVLDPVIQASGGGALITAFALTILEKELIPRCQLITPNLAEAEVFCGKKLNSVEDMERCARELSERWRNAVLIKGGHLKGEIVDVLVEGDKLIKFPHLRQRRGNKIRGTGCALSAAIAAYLAMGKELSEAIAAAINFVELAIQNSYKAGQVEGIGFLAV